MPCSACDLQLGRRGDGESISCAKCPKKYHSACLKMSREESKAIRSSATNYVCPSCKATSKQVRNDDTPVRNTLQSQPPELKDDADTETDTEFLNTALGPAVTPVPSEISTTLTQAVQQLQQVFNSMKKEMAEFTASLNNTTDDITQFRNEILDMKTRLTEIDHCKTEVKNLRAEVTDLRKELAATEQRRYLKDVEITGFPESRNENLHQVLSTVCAKLGVQLDPRDVDDVRRVGKKGDNATAGPERPRPIVLTLTRRAPRDQILHAAKVRRELNTYSLGIPGNNRPIYINEHLTKENRVLYSKTRSVKKQLKFRFAWTSNGSIFLRRTETSSVLHISSEAILNKLLMTAQNNQGPLTEEEGKDTASLPLLDPNVNRLAF